MKKLKKWHRIIIYIFLFFTILLFATPRIAKSYITKNSQELVGRQVEMQSIRINYFSGALRVNDFKIYESIGQDIFIQFDKLLINLDYWPFFKNKLQISEFRIDNLATQILQEGDIFNFSDMMPPSDSTEVASEIDTNSSSMALVMNNIQFNECNIQYTDKLLDHTISMDDINLFVPGFTWSTGSTKLAIDFDFLGGGSFYTALDLNQSDSTFSANLKIDSLNIDVIEPYIKSSIDVSEINGYFSNNIQITGNLQHLTQSHISGWNKVTNLSILNLQTRPVLSFKELLIDFDTLIPHRNNYAFNAITLQEPTILVELIDSTNNWMAMMIPNDSLEVKPTETDSTNEQAEVEYSISLKMLELANGMVIFEDKTLSSPFNSKLGKINISSENIATEAEDVRVKLGAELNKTALLTSTIGFNPKAMENMDINFQIQKFFLKDIEPYMLHYFGYPVEEGILNFETSNKLSLNQTKSNNSLYVRNFKLGKPDKKNAVYRLPLRLGLGIMSDKNNIIEFNIPVERNGEETSINNLGKLIAKSVFNLIIKAATSPVDVLSSLYGTNPDKLNEIQTGLFSSMPDTKGMETLDLIGKILNDKPGLKVELTHKLHRKTFTDSLSYVLAGKAWQENSGKQAIFGNKSIPDSLLSSFLLKKVEVESLNGDTSLQKLCSEFVGMELLNEEYDSTKSKQVDFIKDYLFQHKNLTESRIKFVNTIPDSLNYPSTYNTFFIRFKSIDSY